MNISSQKERKAFWIHIHAVYTPEAIDAALQTLAPDTVRILRLFYEQDLALPEIAGVTGRSLSIVRTHHNRGIFKLRKYFAERPLG